MSQRNLLRLHVRTELTASRAARRTGDVDGAWRHLERAHILSQPSAWLHTRVHASMIVLAIMVMDVRELFGQVVRILVAGIGSLVGRYPVGNTGRARVPIAQPMAIEPDLQAVLDNCAAGRDIQPTRIAGAA